MRITQLGSTLLKLISPAALHQRGTDFSTYFRYLLHGIFNLRETLLELPIVS